jgi:hypothetical protein
VQDSTGAVIPGATVTLINQDQGQSGRTTITNEAGIYLFSALPAATYTVTVELPGFKTYTKKDNKLFVNDKMGLPAIVLEVGAQGESVTVEAETVQLETVSAERSGVVTGRQIVDIALNGRDFTRLLKTIPGAPADTNVGTTTFNGQRSTQNNFTVDGQTVTDSGVNQQFAYRISMDAIAEFKAAIRARKCRSPARAEHPSFTAAVIGSNATRGGMRIRLPTISRGRRGRSTGFSRPATTWVDRPLKTKCFSSSPMNGAGRRHPRRLGSSRFLRHWKEPEISLKRRTEQESP